MERPKTNHGQRQPTNYTHDIDGARPATSSWSRSFNKPDLMTTQDIEGATPKKRWQSATRRDIMAVEDIPGAKPKPLYRGDPRPKSISDYLKKSRPKGFTTKRVTDPLNPVYKLPDYKTAEPLVQKFIRDSMDITDVDGAKPRVSKSSWKTRENFMTISDILGSSAGNCISHAKTTLKMRREENAGKEKTAPEDDFRQKDGLRPRSVALNPLEPTYKIYGEEVRGSSHMKPKRWYARKQRAQFSLLTHDIAGAQPVTMRYEGRRHYTQTNQIDDIEGSGASTVVRGITTTRNPSNPLNPRYVYLDGSTTARSTAAESARNSIHSGEDTVDTDSRCEQPAVPETVLKTVKSTPRLLCRSDSSSKSLRTWGETDLQVDKGLRPKVVFKEKNPRFEAPKSVEYKKPATRAPTPRPKGNTLSSADMHRREIIQSRVHKDKMEVMTLPDSLNACSAFFPNKMLNNIK